MVSAGDRRVVIIVQNLPVPFDRRVWLEATTLVRAGYRVSVICPKMKGFNTGYERLEGVDIYRYPMPFDPSTKIGFFAEFAWCFLRTSLKLFRVATRGGGFDVIHACNPPETYWVLGRLWRFLGKRFVFDHHDLSPEMYEAKFGRSDGFLHKLLLRLERQTFGTADVVITTNDSHKEVATTRGRFAADRVFVVRSGPDLERFDLYEPDPKWRNGKRHLLAFLGDIGNQDGLDVLMRALLALRDDFGRDDVHCVIVGGGNHRAHIQAYAGSLGVDDMCTFTGVVSDQDLCRILSSADVGVDPVPKSSWSDRSTMNKVMEYMYFGLPVVAFDLTETRVSAGEAGVFVEPGDERGLASALSDLFDDPERHARLSKVARQRLTESLAWENSVPPLLAAYTTLFDGSGAGATALTLPGVD